MVTIGLYWRTSAGSLATRFNSGCYSSIFVCIKTLHFYCEHKPMCSGFSRSCLRRGLATAPVPQSWVCDSFSCGSIVKTKRTSLGRQQSSSRRRGIKKNNRCDYRWSVTKCSHAKFQRWIPRAHTCRRSSSYGRCFRSLLSQDA